MLLPCAMCIDKVRHKFFGFNTHNSQAVKKVCIPKARVKKFETKVGSKEMSVIIV